MGGKNDIVLPTSFLEILGMLAVRGHRSKWDPEHGGCCNFTRANKCPSLGLFSDKRFRQKTKYMVNLW